MNSDKIKILLKNYKWVLVFSLAVALAAGVFAWQSGKYSVSLSLTISRAGTQNAVDYKYDSYYALKASDEFGSAVEGWFKTPEMAQAVYKKAGLDFGSLGLAGLSRAFKAAKISPTTVEVRFGANSEDEVKNISQAVAAAAAEKASALRDLSGQGVDFSVTGNEPVIINNSSDLWQKAFLGLILGLIFGIFAKTAGEYFKNSK